MAETTVERQFKDTSLGSLGEKIQGASFILGQAGGVREAFNAVDEALKAEMGERFLDGNTDEAQFLRDVVIPLVERTLKARQKELRKYYNDDLRDPETEVFAELDRRDQKNQKG